MHALHLSAPDSQDLRSRSARMPEVQGPMRVPAHGPPAPSTPVLTYHPVPDSA